MQISKVKIENFKCFGTHDVLLHEQFNLIVGGNGSGKTALLDACAVAIGSFLLGIDGADSRHIRPHEVRLKKISQGGDHNENLRPQRYTWERQYPCAISAEGYLNGKSVSWRRAINSESGRTTYGEANNIKNGATDLARKAREGDVVDLPVLSYYGTGRLWQEPRDNFKVKGTSKAKKNQKKSRLDGYQMSVDPRLSVAQLTAWFAQEAWIAFQNGLNQTTEMEVLGTALMCCIDGMSDIYFDAAAEEIIVEIKGVSQPFSNLSDGQRCMLALVGDIAKKAIILNPHHGGDALKVARGVILVDELDLHLHPRWQRNIVENLRKVFPSMQFICTTHSPFIIQSLRDGEELLVLGGQPTEKVNNRSIEEIVYEIQGVDEIQASVRYAQMHDDAKEILVKLYDSERLSTDERAKLGQEVDLVVKKYADNPAYQAFLEMNRLAKLGGKS